MQDMYIYMSHTRRGFHRTTASATLLKKPFSLRELNPLIDVCLNKGFGNL